MNDINPKLGMTLTAGEAEVLLDISEPEHVKAKMPEREWRHVLNVLEDRLMEGKQRKRAVALRLASRIENLIYRQEK